MEGIKAGVTLMQDFCRPGTDLFRSYIEYLDRDEAQRNEAIQTYNLFHDYMGNPEKSTGLFTSEKDSLTLSEKRELKHIFQTAQDNDSIMWQTVISFDNTWLEKNNLYDSKRGFFDEKKIKEVARLGINRMLEKEGLDLAVWTASIHYNTDNIHVHVATVEPYPMREVMIYQGKSEYRGKFKLKNLELCKSSVVNEIMHTKEVNQKINHIIRERIVKTKQERLLAEDPEIRRLFLQLYESLPNVSKNLIHYDNSLMYSYRPLIDSISRMYLKKYHVQEYREFQEITKRQSELYTEAYGVGQSPRSYAESKEEELMKRLGNAILNEAKTYEMDLNKNIKEWMEYVPRPIENVIGKAGGRVTHKVNISKTLSIDVEEETDKNIEDKEFDLKLSIRQKRKEIDSELQKELELMQYVFCPEEEKLGYGNESEKKYGEWFEKLKNIRQELNPMEGGEVDTKALKKGIEEGEREGNPFILHLKAEMQQVGRVLEINPDSAQESFAKAFEIFCRDEPNLSVECAKKGGFRFDNYVQYRIGKQLNRGWGVEQDNTKAADWYEKSGTSYAKYSLANLYYHGSGVEQDYEIALELYKSVPLNAFAYLKCAEMYEEGLGCKASKPEAEKYCEKAFTQFMSDEEKQPDDIFEYQIGRMLYRGIGCSPNLESSIEYLEKAAEKKNIHAEYLVSKIYIDEGMEAKIPLAIERLTELADKGEQTNAQYALGKLYTNLEKIQYFDINKGVEYLEKASMQEHEYAQYHLGKLYTNPELEIYDLIKGIKYLDASAKQGNEYAQYHLGKLYTNSELEIYDLAKGIEHLEKAAEHENEYAQYRLGKLYMTPELKIYDLYKGISYLESAKDHGNEQAQYLLGCRYLDKEGETYEPNKGIEYIKELAEKGNSYAQTKLGCEYLKGTSVQRDVSEGRTWLSKAAEQDNKIAVTILNDIDTQKISHQGNRSRGELDKALCRLQRSFEEESRRNLKLIKQQELEQEMEPGTEL